ncbi:Sphingomyelin phosphodiesterase [Entamoeba marina]
MSQVSIKVVFMGDSDVGKSSIVNRFINDTFSDEKPANPDKGTTVGKEIVINKVKVSFEIVDLAFDVEATASDFSKAKACVGVFDFSHKDSINNVRNYLALSVRFNSDDKFLQYMVGNKIDGEKVITDEEVEKNVSALQGVRYHAVSAKTGEGVKEFFESIAKDVLEAYNIAGSKSGKSKGDKKGKCLLF